MNNKHLACFVLMMFLVIELYAVFMMHSKASAMKQEAADGQAAAETATSDVNIKKAALNGLKVRTEPLVLFLNEWDPFLRQVSSAERGEQLIEALIKQAGVMCIDRRYSKGSATGLSYLPGTLSASLLLEDDYARTLQWLGDLESSLPASRVMTCTLSKGQNSNDVRMQLTVELPLVEAAVAAK